LATARARNIDGSTFEKIHGTTAIRAARLRAPGPAASGDVRDPQLSAGLTAGEPTPEAGAA